MDFNKPFGEQVTTGQTQGTNQDYLNNIQETTKTGMNNISDSFNNIRDTVQTSVNEFQSKDTMTLGSEFINSNTIVAKFVFLVLVLIGFMVLLNLGLYLVAYFTRPTKSPYVVKGLSNGNNSKTAVQDPKNGSSVTIYRSNNENKGMEFTWSVWLKRDKPLEMDTHHEYEHIFNKGENTGNYDDVGGNAPGVYFYNPPPPIEDGAVVPTITNKIKIKMDIVPTAPIDGNNTFEEIEIDNLPFNKWFHLAIRLENKVMDVYVNGAIAKRITFGYLPKQNYGDVHVVKNGGFSGSLSDLRYFDRGLNVFQIMNVVNSGPNLRSSDADKNRDFDYLSSSWYMSDVA
jgi:hypothetical protein